ncbi:hypothetical protein DZF91_11720 [Actinomadura logoneensis]|uniref:Small secreted protein n=1 Tax=Actinomadura logoneensis TaxID=2293572 RepID=A0A372JQ34_9ACTN|nr:hypothetical protein [Actinomadura logoneensis]RFU41438.1 hypothetical protein DZF91_11720 [Actinomadura logoneensis]
MRMSASHLIGTVVLGGALIASAACGPLDSVTGGNKKAACDNIQSELASIKTKITSPDASNLRASSAANARLYRDAAGKIRSEGAKAGGDVQSSSDKVASDLESLATVLGNIGAGGTGTSNMSGSRNFIQDAAALGRACGYSG